MTDYKAIIERDGCETGCGHSKICMCALAEDMADEIERLREELYEIKLAAAGGEDAPGAANMVTANDVEKWVTKYCEEIERLREALREMLSVAEVDQLENLSICDIGSERSKMKNRAVASRCGMLLGKLRKIARAALGEGKHE